jgi:hypothetical protein
MAESYRRHQSVFQMTEKDRGSRMYQAFCYVRFPFRTERICLRLQGRRISPPTRVILARQRPRHASIPTIQCHIETARLCLRLRATLRRLAIGHTAQTPAQDHALIKASWEDVVHAIYFNWWINIDSLACCYGTWPSGSQDPWEAHLFPMNP